MKLVTSYQLSVISLIILLSLPGCAKKPSGKVVAKVNNDPIYASDLKREVALKTKTDPLFKITPHTLENEVDNIINKRLLIQEAQKLKLAQTDRFVNTIKAFWEQTLIRDLIIAKNEDFKDKITVTDAEVKDYYSKLAQKAIFKIIKRKDKALLETILGIEKDLIAWEKMIGPVGYEDIDSLVLRRAFGLPVGEARIFRDKDSFYLVYVAEKIPAFAPPLEEIYPAIEKQIKQHKQNLAIKQWLDDIKKKAKIEIDKKYLNTFKEE